MALHKRSIVLRIGVLVVLITIGTVNVFTQPIQDTIYTYYSDSTYTTVVGHLYDMCSGRWRDGVTSGYVNMDYGYPCGQGPCFGCMTGENQTYPEACWDGIDNDQDGLTDCGDPGCYEWCDND